MYRLSLVLLLVCPTIQLLQAAPPDTHDRQDDAKVLTEAGVAAEPMALVARFRQRVLASQPDNLSAALQRLGDASFSARNQASKDILAAGPAALSRLRPLLKSPDAEVARRAEACYRAIEKSGSAYVSEAAARLLAARPPDDTLSVLVDFLPWAEDEGVAKAVRESLATVGIRHGVPDPLIVAALHNREPARRAAATFLVGRSKTSYHHHVASLLHDAEPQVRFEAATVMLQDGDARVVPVLIALLNEASLTTAWRSERLLGKLASGRGPKVILQGSNRSRCRCRDGWADWWRTHKDKVDLKGRHWEENHSLILLSDLDDGCIFALGLDFKEHWHIDGCKGPVDCQLLPNGRLLVVENHGLRVTERDGTGQIVWEKTLDSPPLRCWRWSDGNTEIAMREAIIEVAPDGKEIRRPFKLVNDPKSFSPEVIRCVQRLRDDSIVVLTDRGPFTRIDRNGVKIDGFETPDGDYLHKFFVVLPNGHYLCTGHRKGGAVEYDRRGKLVWERANDTSSSPIGSFISVARLANGHIVGTCTDETVKEWSREVRPISRYLTDGRPWHIQFVP